MKVKQKIEAMLKRKQEQKGVVEHYIAGDISGEALILTQPMLDSIYEDIKELEEMLK